MDYDSPGAYKKNKLTKYTMYNGGRFHCDRCDKIPDRLVLVLRGGYVQEQICEECEGNV